MQATLSEAIHFFGSEFWAAIAGAVVGGVITYLIQVQSLREARRARDAERNQADKAIGYSLALKTTALWNNIARMKLQIDGAREKQRNGGLNSLFIALQPLVNLPEPVQYETRELSLLFTIGVPETLNKVFRLDTIHNSLLPVWTLYASKREQLNDAVQVLGIDGESGIASIAIPKGSPGGRLMFEVNDLAEKLAQRVELDELHAREARDMLVTALNTKLGLNIKYQPPE